MNSLLPTVDNDPHFIVNVEGIGEGVCFDINGRPGNVYQLLHDKATGECETREWRLV